MTENAELLAEVERAERRIKAAGAAYAAHLAVNAANETRDQWVLAALEAGNTTRGLGTRLGVTKDTILRMANRARAARLGRVRGS